MPKNNYAKIPISEFISDKNLKKIRKVIEKGGDLEDAYHDIQDIMKDAGYDVKDFGTNRQVFVDENGKHKKVVFKVAGDNQGIEANRREFYNGDIDDSLVFSYSISKDGIFLVQERVKPFTSEDMEEHKDEVRDMLRHLGKKILLVDCELAHFKNFGTRKDGTIVLLDHGDTVPLPKYQTQCVNMDEESYVSLRCSSIMKPQNKFEALMNNKTQYCGGQLEYNKNFTSLICKKCGSSMPISAAYHQAIVGDGTEKNKGLLSIGQSFENWCEARNEEISKYCESVMDAIEEQESEKLVYENEKENTEMGKTINGQECMNFKGWWIPVELFEKTNPLKINCMKTNKVPVDKFLRENGLNPEEYKVMIEDHKKYPKDEPVLLEADKIVKIASDIIDVAVRALLSYNQAMEDDHLDNVMVDLDCVDWGVKVKGKNVVGVFTALKEHPLVSKCSYSVQYNYIAIKLVDNFEEYATRYTDDELNDQYYIHAIRHAYYRGSIYRMKNNLPHINIHTGDIIAYPKEEDKKFIWRILTVFKKESKFHLDFDLIDDYNEAERKAKEERIAALEASEETIEDEEENAIINSHEDLEPVAEDEDEIADIEDIKKEIRGETSNDPGKPKKGPTFRELINRYKYATGESDTIENEPEEETEEEKLKHICNIDVLFEMAGDIAQRNEITSELNDIIRLVETSYPYNVTRTAIEETAAYNIFDCTKNEEYDIEYSDIKNCLINTNMPDLINLVLRMVNKNIHIISCEEIPNTYSFVNNETYLGYCALEAMKLFIDYNVCCDTTEFVMKLWAIGANNDLMAYVFEFMNNLVSTKFAGSLFNDIDYVVERELDDKWYIPFYMAADAFLEYISKTCKKNSDLLDSNKNIFIARAVNAKRLLDSTITDIMQNGPELCRDQFIANRDVCKDFAAAEMPDEHDGVDSTIPRSRAILFNIMNECVNEVRPSVETAVVADCKKNEEVSTEMSEKDLAHELLNQIEDAVVNDCDPMEDIHKLLKILVTRL